MGRGQTVGSFLFLFFCCTDFWLCWVWAAVRAFSGCGERGLLSGCSARTPRCGAFSCCGGWASVVEAGGLGNCGSRALELGLRSGAAQA